MKNIIKSEEFDLIKIFGQKRVVKWLMDYPILKCEEVKKWIIDKIDKFTDEGKEANKFSVQSYLKPLLQYCNYNKVKDTSELLKEDIDQRNLRLKKYLKDFLLNQETELEVLKEIGFRKRPGEVYIRNMIQSRIKSFYSNRGASISFNMKSKKSGANKREITLSKQIIKKIQAKLESSNYRLICKIESQLGLRISDILEELASGKYIIEQYNGRYFVRNFETQKRKVTINYLFFTKELEETLQANMGINDLTKLDLTQLFLTRNGTRINGNDYLQRLKAIIKELGIMGNIKTHGFRKYFIGAIGKCANNLSDPRIITHFEGHEASFTDQAYLRLIKDIDTYFEEWKKTEICVCIDCIAIDKTDTEVLALKEENIKVNNRLDLVLKENIELKANMNQIIEQVKTEKSKFATNLLEKLSNFNPNKTEFKKHIDGNSENIDSNDIVMDLLVQKLFETFKQ